MTAGTDVLVAVIAAGATITAAVLTMIGNVVKLRRENRKQHGSVGEALARVETKVEMTHEGVRDVAARLDDHINGPHHTSSVIVHPRHITGGNADVA